MPDEKVIITLIAYINIRLMELSIEIRAARKILHAWNTYKLRKQHKKLKVLIILKYPFSVKPFYNNTCWSKKGIKYYTWLNIIFIVSE